MTIRIAGFAPLRTMVLAAREHVTNIFLLHQGSRIQYWRCQLLGKPRMSASYTDVRNSEADSGKCIEAEAQSIYFIAKLLLKSRALNTGWYAFA
jgi:hypothetical protein